MDENVYKVVFEPFQTSSATSEIEMSGKDEQDVVRQFREQRPAATLLSVTRK